MSKKEKKKKQKNESHVRFLTSIENELISIQGRSLLRVGRDGKRPLSEFERHYLATRGFIVPKRMRLDARCGVARMAELWDEELEGEAS